MRARWAGPAAGATPGRRAASRRRSASAAARPTRPPARAQAAADGRAVGRRLRAPVRYRRCRPTTSRPRSTTSTTRRTSGTPTRRSTPTRWPAGTGCSGTTSSSSPAPTSTGPRWPRRRRSTASPRRSGPTGSARFEGAWAARHRQRRLHPDDRAAAPRGGPAVPPAHLRQRLHRARLLPGPLLRVVRGLLHRGPAGRRQLPGPRPPGRRDGGGELLLQAEPFEDRLLEWYDSQPDGVRPAGKRNEALSFIKGGLKDISITRTSLSGACRSRGTTGTSSTSGTTRSINYLTAIGYGSDDERFEAWWPAAPPDRQGDHPVPLRLVAGDVHGGRHRPAGGGVRPRLAARRRPEAVDVASGPPAAKGRPSS